MKQNHLNKKRIKEKEKEYDPFLQFYFLPF